MTISQRKFKSVGLKSVCLISQVISLAAVCHLCQLQTRPGLALQVAPLSLNFHPKQQQATQSQIQIQSSYPDSSNSNSRQQVHPSGQQAPLIAPFSFDANVLEGQRTSVLCSIARGDLPLTIRWLKDGQLLSQEMANLHRITIKPDTDSSTLKFGLVKLEHAGNYTCEVDNRSGSHAHTAELLVHSEPRWLVHSHLNAPEHLTVNRGANVVIDCQAIGWPKPSQTWSIKTHSQNDFQLLTNDAKHSIAANGSLLIKNASKLDEANYLCKAQNGIGRGIAWSTALRVSVPAYFDSNKQQTHLVRKQTQIQLRCDAHGDEPLTIEWFKDKQRLSADFDPRYTVHTTKSGQPGQPSEGLISVLIIKQAQRQDNSLFECVTRNQAGRDRLQIELVVQEEPDHIQAIQASQISPRNVSLVWSEPYDGKAPITSYIIQYKRVNEILFGSSSRDATLSDLLAMEHQLLLGGPGSGSSGVTQLQQAQANNPNSQLQQQQVVLDQFSLNQQAADSDEQQQQAQQHQAQHSLLSSIKQTIADDWQQATRLQLPVQLISNSSNPNPNSSSKQHLPPSTTRSYTIERLEPSSKYVVRALAVNSIGQSKFSQPIEFVTDEDAPEVGPSRIKATAINSTSILVSWDELARGRNANQVHGYYVGYRVAAQTPTASQQAGNNSQQTSSSNFILKPYIINDLINSNQNQQQMLSFVNSIQQQDSNSISSFNSNNQNNNLREPNRLETVISDLKRNTLYEITVNAFNSQGSGPSGDLVACKTIEMEAPKPVKLLIRRESNESIFLEWHRDPSDQNPVDDYVLFQEKNSASKELSQVRLPGNQTQYKAPGLKCGTRYQFYVIAQNRVGKSRPSELVSASTSGAAPLIPRKTSLIKMVNSTCLEINLNAFQDNGCRLKTFTVRYRAERIVANGSSASLTGSSNGHLLQGQALKGADAQSLTSGQTSASSGGNVGALSVAGAPQSVPGDWNTVRPRANANNKYNNQQQQQQQYVPFQRLSQPGPSSDEDKLELLCNLNPTGEYTIHVSASNDVGRSEIEYTVLMSSDELRYSFLRELGESFAQLPNMLAYIPSIIVFLLAALIVCLCALILYTTAIKYYQKFVIMQNQIRATKRAKADERRRRKLNGGSSSSRANLSQNKAELWAEEYDEDEDPMGSAEMNVDCGTEGDDDENGDDNDNDDCDHDANNLMSSNGNGRRQQRNNRSQHYKLDYKQHQLMLGDEDEANLTSASSSANSSSANSMKNRRVRRQSRAKQQHQTLKQQRLLHQQQLHFANRSSQQLMNGHYLSNLHAGSGHGSGFDSSSMDSSMIGMMQTSDQAAGNKLINGPQQLLHNSPSKYGIPPMQSGLMNHNGKLDHSPKGCSMSTASTDSIHGPFQCLNSKQYVKMNEYTMMPSISASLSQAAASDIYGTALNNKPQQATIINNNNNPNVQRSASLYYSTLRRTNMQTYLPHVQRQQQQQQQQQQMTVAGQAINMQRQQQVAMHHHQQQQYQSLGNRQQQQQAPANDIYGYHYVSPKMAQVSAAGVSNGLGASTNSSNSPVSNGASPMSCSSSQQSSVHQHKQQQDEVANSIFVPPQQQIVYSAPNIRHQPSVFL